MPATTLHVLTLVGRVGFEPATFILRGAGQEVHDNRADRSLPIQIQPGRFRIPSLGSGPIPCQWVGKRLAERRASVDTPAGRLLRGGTNGNHGPGARRQFRRSRRIGRPSESTFPPKTAQASRRRGFRRALVVLSLAPNRITNGANEFQTLCYHQHRHQRRGRAIRGRESAAASRRSAGVSTDCSTAS